MSASNGPENPPRFDKIPVDKLTPEQRKLYDAIRSGPRAKISGSGAASAGPVATTVNSRKPSRTERSIELPR